MYSLWELVIYFLKLGTVGFGGPVALIEYMRWDLVEERKWISEADYMEGLALSQLAPGPLAAQLAIYLGFVHYRVVGATLAGFAFVLPSSGRRRTFLLLNIPPPPASINEKARMGKFPTRALQPKQPIPAKRASPSATAAAQPDCRPRRLSTDVHRLRSSWERFLFGQELRTPRSLRPCACQGRG